MMVCEMGFICSPPGWLTVIPTHEGTPRSPSKSRFGPRAGLAAMRIPPCWFVICLTLGARSLAAQSSLAAGVTVGSAKLTVVLPTGNAACGLGSGTTSAGLDIGLGVSPNPQLHLSADASRSISNASSQSTLSAPRATSLLLSGGYDVSASWRADVSLGIDVGQVDSTQALSRVVGGGVSHRVGSSLALTLDASAGLTAGSPKWVISLGLGGVFAGTSPVGLSAPLRRLKSSFTGGVNRQSGT